MFETMTGIHVKAQIGHIRHLLQRLHLDRWLNQTRLTAQVLAVPAKSSGPSPSSAHQHTYETLAARVCRWDTLHSYALDQLMPISTEIWQAV